MDDLWLHLLIRGSCSPAPSFGDLLVDYYFLGVPQNEDDLVIGHLEFDLCCIADVAEEV